MWNDSFNLDVLHPEVYPDTVLMVVNGRIIHKVENGVITSSLHRPFFASLEWAVDSCFVNGGGKTAKKYFYTLSESDYE